MKRILICCMLCCLVMQGIGQQLLSSKEMVALTPAVPASLELPEQAKKALNQRLIQIVTQNGFGSTSGNLILTANVLVIDKQITGTVPAQFIISLEVSLYLLNLQEEVILDEMAIEVKGIDKLENRAIAQAINSINPRTPTVRKFMAQCRTKVIDYYTTRVPALLAKAKSLTDRKEYQEALAVLSAVPESVDEYPAVAEQMVSIYTQQLDKEATVALQTAKVYVTQKEYGQALDALLKIDPSSTRFSEADKMIASIKASMDAEAKAAAEEKLARYEAEMEARQREHDDQMMLERMRLEMAQKAGMSYGKTIAEENVSEQLSKWFLGKFK